MSAVMSSPAGDAAAAPPQAKRAPPLLQRAQVQRVFYPLLVAVLLIGLW